MAPSSLDLKLNGDVFQNALYIGTNIENILYGIELFLYFKTIQIILSRRRARTRSDTFYAIFSSMMVFVTTVWIACQASFGQHMWLLNSDFPGGANAYWQEHFSDWYMDWGTTAAIVLQLMTDALMIYRCRIVWNSHRAIIIPIILWLATLTLGFLADWTSSVPGGNIFIGTAAELGLAYWTVSVFLNATLTCMICYRIMRHGRLVQEYLGHEYASFYLTITTIIVESVLPYTVSGIAFLVPYGMGNGISTAFGSVYILMMCISPQLLILRAIVGKAWDSDTSRVPGNSRVRFSFEAISASQGPGGTIMHLQGLPDACSSDEPDKA